MSLPDDEKTPVTRTLRRDGKLLALLDAARELAELVDAGSHLRAVAVKELEEVAIAWAADQCPTCGRRGDHEWEELTDTERLAHEAEATRLGT